MSAASEIRSIEILRSRCCKSPARADAQTELACRRSPCVVPVTNSSMVPDSALLARGARRSEGDHDLEAAASFAMRPVTGTFVDPAIESAFGAHLFRLAFPVHILLFCFGLAVSVWIVAVGAKGEVGPWEIVSRGAVLGMACRVLLHVNYPYEDAVIAQRLGSRAWIALMAVCNLALMAGTMASPAIECLAAERDILMVSARSSNPASAPAERLTPC